MKVNVGGCLTSDLLSIPTITAYVAVSHQAGGVTPLGTIVLLDGDGGTSFFNSGDGTNQYVADYYNHGFTTVQFAWADAWNDNSAEPDVKSVKDEACRPATLLKFIYDTYANDSGAMCAQGHSGGASALGYAMEFYGADRAASTINGSGYLDTVVMTSGPTLADIYNGCHYAGSGSQAAASNVCHGGVCVGAAAQWPSCLEHPMGGQADCFGDNKTYPTGGLYDTARGVTMHTIGNFQQPQANCNNWKGTGVSTSGAIDDAWKDMSLVPAPYHQYPQTFVYGFLCSGRDTDPNDPNVDISNSSAAQGWSYLSTLSVSSHQFSGFPQIYRVNGCADPEMIWKPTSTVVGSTRSGYGESEFEMQTNCAVHPQ
jgi:hypothetical protein